MIIIDLQSEAGPRRLMVGLTGSTINALFGSKKTAVAPTPGKTKHIQTLNVTERLTLCDCPGLVLLRYAASKAEMVAAGEPYNQSAALLAVVCLTVLQGCFCKA